jgi:uncharacterized protein (DUF433 family)
MESQPIELTIVQHITVTSGLRGGKPHIVGRRITVSDVAFFHLRQGMFVAEIAAEYDLSLAEVHAALPITSITAKRSTGVQLKMKLLRKNISNNIHRCFRKD